MGCPLKKGKRQSAAPCLHDMGLASGFGEREDCGSLYEYIVYKSPNQIGLLAASVWTFVGL
jgi:hypothetical protein